MGLRGWVKDKANKAKKTADKAKREAEKLANKAKHEAEDAARAAKKEAERAAREAEKLANQLERELLKEARNVVQKIFDRAKRDIERFAENAVKETKEAFTKDLPGLAEKAFEETREAFEEELPKLLDKAFDALAEAITKEGLKAVRDGVRSADRELESLAKSKPELAGAIDTLGFSLKLGPMTLSYSGFYTRSSKLADTLDTYVNEPPVFRRRPLIQLIEALGPDSVDLGVDISVAFLVAQSDALEVGFSLDAIPMEVFSEIADAVLEAIGVPE